MRRYRAKVRDARDRVFAPSVQQTVTATTAEVTRAILPALAELRGIPAELAELPELTELRRILPELAELRRILADQGDAADEVAEALGRTLTRLSAEVSDLGAEVVRLRARLDHLDTRP